MLIGENANSDFAIESLSAKPSLMKVYLPTHRNRRLIRYAMPPAIVDIVFD
jgi:hypothetical protein